jgi:hypothetical protein
VIGEVLVKKTEACGVLAATKDIEIYVYTYCLRVTYSIILIA